MRIACGASVQVVKPQWIFHLAVYGAYSWQIQPHAIFQTNVLGTVNLLEACLEVGFEGFVNTGSSSEYGIKRFAPAEDCWVEPNSCYAASKASATLYCRHKAQQSGSHVVTLRLYSIYGAYEEPNRFMPSLVLHGMDGQYPPLTNPKTARDFVHVEDAVDAYLLAVTARGQEAGAVYNVGTGVQTSLGEVVELARSLFSLKAEPTWNNMPGRVWDTDIWVANSQRIREALGWQPRRSLAEGLGGLGNWFTKHPDMMAHYRHCIQNRPAA